MTPVTSRDSLEWEIPMQRVTIQDAECQFTKHQGNHLAISLSSQPVTHQPL
jgi:hypothetical protein